MRQKDEAAYYQLLGSFVRNEKNNTPFFNSRKHKKQYEADIAALLSRFEKENSHLLKHLVSHHIKIIRRPHKNDVLKQASTLSKGTITAWRDETGRPAFLVSAGKDGKGRRLLIVMNKKFKPKNTKDLKEQIKNKLLKNDIELLYRRYSGDNIKRKQKTGTRTAAPGHAPQRYSGGFEKLFKDMIIQIGASASPMKTAGAIIQNMNGNERQNLSRTFLLLGARTGKDVETLLSQWKNEALYAPTPQVRKIKTMGIHINRQIAVSYERYGAAAYE